MDRDASIYTMACQFGGMAFVVMQQGCQIGMQVGEKAGMRFATSGYDVATLCAGYKLGQYVALRVYDKFDPQNFFTKKIIGAASIAFHFLTATLVYAVTHPKMPVKEAFSTALSMFPLAFVLFVPTAAVVFRIAYRQGQREQQRIQKAQSDTGKETEQVPAKVVVEDSSTSKAKDT